MTPHSIDQASERGLRAWLAAPVPSSPFQARMQQLSLKWWRLRANPAAMFGLAVIVLIVLDILVVATIIAFWRVRKLAAWLMVPYLAWVLFATLLNYQFLQANPEADGADAPSAVQRMEL